MVGGFSLSVHSLRSVPMILEENARTHTHTQEWRQTTSECWRETAVTGSSARCCPVRLWQLCR